MPYKTILVPVDGNKPAKTGIDEALRIATFTGGTVHGLYVFDTGEYETVTPSDRAINEEDLTDCNKQPLAAVESRAEDAGVPVETAVTRGGCPTKRSSRMLTNRILISSLWARMAARASVIF